MRLVLDENSNETYEEQVWNKTLKTGCFDFEVSWQDIMLFARPNSPCYDVRKNEEVLFLHMGPIKLTAKLPSINTEEERE